MKSYTHAILCAVAILGSGLRVSGHTTKKLLSRSTRTVDGLKTSIENVPWHVGLIYVWGSATYPICGGSIISSQWVVTAGTCVDAVVFGRQPSTFISAGSADFNEGSRHTIVDKIRHPLYEVQEEPTKVVLNDIALLRVREAFIFDKTCQAISLYNQHQETLHQSPASAIGWGAIKVKGDDVSFDLQVATMKITSVPECQAFLSTIYNSSVVPAGQICAQSLSGTVCSDDSGGPLTVNRTLVGISSWKSGTWCTNDSPSVFTEVAYYRRWIFDMLLL